MPKSPLKTALAGLMVLGAITALPHQGYAKGKPAELKNIVQTAREAGAFTTLLKALEATDLVGTLSGQGKGPFTVFAPTDAAFAKLPAGTVESLLGNPEALKKILLYHVVAGEYPASEVVKVSSLQTVNGQSVTITTTGGVKVDGASVTAADVRARNGIIHVIDTVLIPR